MNIDQIKSVFPDFQMENFRMFDQVLLLKWECVFDPETWEEHRNLFLKMTNADHDIIQMECRCVEKFHFQGNGQISGFIIEDMSASGYENRVRYKVGDYEEGELGFYCSDIVVEHLEKGRS